MFCPLPIPVFLFLHRLVRFVFFFFMSSHHHHSSKTAESRRGLKKRRKIGKPRQVTYAIPGTMDVHDRGTHFSVHGTGVAQKKTPSPAWLTVNFFTLSPCRLLSNVACTAVECWNSWETGFGAARVRKHVSHTVMGNRRCLD